VLAYEAADDYLRAVALALLAWAWSRIDRVSQNAPRWRQASAALHLRVLPEFDMRLGIMWGQCTPAPAALT